MPRTISRRRLVATAISGSVAGLYVLFFAAHVGRVYQIPRYSELFALCSDLRCPQTIGKACLLALPASETARSSLARAILADVELAGRNCSVSNVLGEAISERSRSDFRDGRVITVDGWIFSLTETRVYALAALLAEAHVHVA